MERDDIVLEDLSSAANSFGLSTQVISDAEMTNLIFGPSTNPSDAKPIEEKSTEEEKKTPTKLKKEEEKNDDLVVDEDELKKEILGDDDEEEDDDPSVTPGTKKLEKDDKKKKKEAEDNTYALLTNDLFDAGIFTKFDDEEEDEVTTPEQFGERFQKEITNRVNDTIYNFLVEKHGQEGLDMFNSIFVKGVPPEKYLSIHTRIESFKDLDLTKEENQERVYRAYYKKLGWEDNRIEDRLQKLKEYAMLEDESQIAHEKLVEQEKLELEKTEQEEEKKLKAKAAQRQSEAQSFNNILTAKLKEREFDGIPVTDKVAKEVFADLVQDRYELPNGEKLTEFDKKILDLKLPQNYELKVKLWLLLKNDLDLSKVKTKALSEKADKLFKNVATKERTQSRTNILPNSNSFGQFL